MINPYNIHEKLVKLGEEWAIANYAADLLEETKKPELARLMSKVDGSIAAKEAEAQANPLYREHIAKMCEARRDANIAKVKYDSAKAYVELLRTQSANERAANRVAV